MPVFTGTDAAETITPITVSPTVATTGAPKPSNADDDIFGFGGADTIDSGGGNDTVFGGTGNDTAKLGTGNDTFVWNPGDGNDIVEGGSGLDTLDFQASVGAEIIDILASAGLVRVTRNLSNVVLSLNDVETIRVRAFSGTDSIVVGNLAGTDATLVDIDVGAADGQADSVTVGGSAGADAISVLGNGTAASVAGLSASVFIGSLEAANDSLTISGMGGNDTISAASFSGPATLIIDGGTGDDTLFGSLSADIFRGGDGNDIVDGGDQNDTAFLGAGNDRFIWSPGDDSDIVEGQDGTDTLVFNGANAGEIFTLSANGGRVLFTRNVANIVMDLDDTEVLQLQALAGANNLNIGNLSGTDMVRVIYTGGAVVDTIAAAATNADITASGGGDSDSFITGTGADVLLGEAGGDTLDGGGSNDILIGGADADTLRGGTGNDGFRYLAGAELVAGELIDGQGGTSDALQLLNAGAINFRLVNFVEIEVLRFLSGTSTATFNANQIGMAGIGIMVGGAGADRLTVVGTNVDLSSLVVSTWNNAVDRISLIGTAGADVLVGTKVSDILIGGAGANILRGALGNDTYVLANGTANIADTGGVDTITSTISRSILSLASIENLTLLGVAAANGTGNAAANTIAGNAGKNTLTGLAGNDAINAGSNDDVLIGGVGKDAQTGGLGRDRFDYNTIAESGVAVNTRDIIRDFAHGLDRIDLSTIDANGSAAGSARFAFIAAEGAAFTGVRGQLRWDQQNNAGTGNDRTVIYGDLTGDRVADFSIELSGLRMLTATDFVL